MSEVVLDHVSKWYDLVSAVNDLTLTLEPGITGLLGDNGAGKSTLLKLLAGLLRPSRGRVSIFGAAPVDDPRVLRRVGYCPEHESAYDELSGVEFVSFCSQLHGLDAPSATQGAEALLTELGLGDAMHRRIGEYSKGMRQRAKIAQSLAHEPDLVLLDEPLSGCDPIAKAKVMDVIRRFGARGKIVLISSHVLSEIESLTSKIVLIHKGRVLADGDVHRIRDLIDEHPHRVRIETDRPRALAAAFAAEPHIVSLDISDIAVELETREPDRCYTAIPVFAEAAGARITALTSPDDNMAAVFRYLTEDGG